MNSFLTGEISLSLRKAAHVAALLYGLRGTETAIKIKLLSLVIRHWGES